MVNFRADAFDRLQIVEGSPLGLFPLGVGGWTISNERFMRDIDPKIISFLKLRASYGVNGNISALGAFMYSSSMSVGDYYPMNGSLVSTVYPSDVLANPDLKWETARQFDVGVDARFLNNRLTFGMDFYNKNTVDPDSYIDATPCDGYHEHGEEHRQGEQPRLRVRTRLAGSGR